MKLIGGAASLLLALLALVVVPAAAPPAHASGIITHSWMAAAAIPLVDDADLRALLRAHARDVEGGAHFPDSGYGAGVLGVEMDYGEEAHWPRFSYALADEIVANPNCGDLSDPSGPCARRIALLMGAVAHGMGDEVWDWLFEPNAPDRGESYVPPALAGQFSTGGLEMQMDLVAIGDYDRPASPDLPQWPTPARLAAAFAAVGRGDVSVQDMATGQLSMTVARQAERTLTATYRGQITRNMPWTSAHVVTGPGGIRFAARAIAAAWENLWARMHGGAPATEVSVTHPAAGQTQVPASGWDRSEFLPGSHPDRGGARQRIAAVLDASLPYRRLTTDPVVPLEVPAGSMTLVEEASGDPVPLRAGYPKVVPYGPDSGSHVIALQPDGNLEPCTTYRAAVTEQLLDLDEQPVTPYSWTFTTSGAACPRAAARPDLQAKRGAIGALVGDDVYSPGGGQTRLLRARPGSTATFTVRLQNDGSEPDRLEVRGQPSAGPFTVRYLSGGVNVTNRVVAGTFRTPQLAPTVSRNLTVRVAVARTARAGAAVNRLVTATSVSDGGLVDGVRLTVRRSAPPSRAAREAAVEARSLTDAELAEAARWLQICSLQ